MLWDGAVFAMAGASRRHNLLVAALLRDIGAQVRGTRCSPDASDQRVRLPGGERYVYPDVTVACRPLEVDPRDPDTLTRPTVLVEVLSDSTEAFDRGAKFIAYRALDSLSDCLLVSQHDARVEHYTRQAGGAWLLRTAGAGESLEIASVGITLQIDALYEGVLLEPDPDHVTLRERP